jgi:hypothetical protein
MFKTLFLLGNLSKRIDDIEKKIEEIRYDLMILNIKSRQEHESLKDFFLGE